MFQLYKKFKNNQRLDHFSLHDLSLSWMPTSSPLVLQVLDASLIYTVLCNNRFVVALKKKIQNTAWGN